MDRVEFTRKITALIQEMITAGEQPIGDYWKRSDYEQERLYRIGRVQLKDGSWVVNNPNATVTTIDGVDVKSRHQ